jgi:hypothetical protein
MLPGMNVRRDGGRRTLLTGHGHVPAEIARNPRARIRDIAAAAGIAERTAHGIIADLETAGYLTRARSGRRTVYTVYPDRPFRHPAQKGHRVGPFLGRRGTAPQAAGPGGRGQPNDDRGGPRGAERVAGQARPRDRHPAAGTRGRSSRRAAMTPVKCAIGAMRSATSTTSRRSSSVPCRRIFTADPPPGPLRRRS